jgi:hypothetical protein
MFWNRLVEDYFKTGLRMIWIVMVTFGASIQGLSLHFMLCLLPPTPTASRSILFGGSVF